MSRTCFSSLKLRTELLENLISLNYLTMTPIQEKSLPHILLGKDVIAQGKTGSGKTAAFGLGLLEKLEVKRFCVQSLVLCPTRELADQVAKELRKLARATHNIKILTLCGGMPFGPQSNSLEHGAHIIVGTPGRIEDHLRKGTLNLQELTVFVLDEADRMLDMGFQVTLDSLIEHIPDKRQTLLFSATYPEKIQAIAKRIMVDPIMVQAISTHDKTSIEQRFYKVNDDDQQRMEALRLLLLAHRPESALIFCNTKRETQNVADELARRGFSVLALHGDLDQKDREQILVRFSNKSTSILVATDVASRGLDIDALDAVINFHLSRDPEVHVHRIGRTGRAGSKGIAYTLHTDKENHKIVQLEDYLSQDIKYEILPPLSLLNTPPYQPDMITLRIDGGKKQKVRPGDILGALTGENGITGSQVGKIIIADNWAYVAINHDVAKHALKKLETGKLKGHSFRVRQI